MSHPSEPSGDVIAHTVGVYQAELEVQNEELRHTRDQLAASRDRYFRLFDVCPVGIVEVDAGGVVQDANRSAARLLGRATDRLVGRHFLGVIDPADHPVWTDHLRSSLSAGGRPRSCALRVRTSGEHPAPPRLGLQSVAIPRPAHPNSAASTSLLVTLRDTTREHRARAGLERDRNQLAAVLAGLPVGVLVVEDTAVSGPRIVDSNLAADALVGRSLHGHALADAISGSPQGAWAALRESVASEAPGVQLDLVRLDGGTTPVEARAAPMGLQGLRWVVGLRDLRPEQTAAADRRLAAREAARGAELLAATEAAAHAATHLHPLLLSIPDEAAARARPHLDRLRQAATTALGPPEPIDLHRLLSRAGPTLASAVAPRLLAHLPVVLARREALSTAIAQQALALGHIERITTDNADSDRITLTWHGRICVVPETVAARIQGAGGTTEVTPTAVVWTLPRHRRSLSELPTLKALGHSPPRAVPPRHIHLIDDDAWLREGVARTLTADGHTVTTAAAPGPLPQDTDLVFLDVQLAGRSGVAWLRTAPPAVPVVLWSGLPLRTVAQIDGSQLAAGFLAKPFGRQQLRAALAELDA